ncbi:MAG: hypothetical protein EHM91_05460, partial [Planctomycetota bacterium]
MLAWAVTCGLLLRLQQGPDLDAVLKKADALLEEARQGYQSARGNASVQEYIKAGFTLEEARIKYLVLQEVGSPDQQKTAAGRLREVQQLTKLIGEAKVASARPPTVESPPPAPAPPPPGSPAPPAAPPAPAPAELNAGSRLLPVPEVAALKEAEKLLKELFKEDYAKKDPAGRKALSRTLMGQRSKVAGDPASAYVLFRDAVDAAVQGNDLVMAFRALDELSSRFDVDGPALRLAALTSLGKTARTPGELGLLAETHFNLLDEHLAMDQYSAADKAAAAAILFAKKSGSLPLTALALERKKDADEAAARFRAMKGVLEALAANPDHPESNLEMGRFLCFTKGNWDLGLRFLAKGSDPALKNLASAESTGLTENPERQKLADGWFELFQKEPPSLKKKHLGLHARGLYESTLAAATGLGKARIEKRLEALPAPEASRYGSSVDLMPLVDVSRSLVGGWTMGGGALICGPGGHTRVPILYQLPDEYDLKIVVTRIDFGGSLSVGLGSQDIRFSMTLDGWAPKVNGFFYIDGKTPENNPSTHRGSVVTNKKPLTLVITVRRDELGLEVDGRRISSFKGDFT